MARVDYIKLGWEGDNRHPDYPTYSGRWAAWVAQWEMDSDVWKAHNAESIYTGQYKTLKIFEVWGPAAQNVWDALRTLPVGTREGVKLLRVDVRQELPEATSITDVANALAGAKGKNVQTFNTRPRTKKGDRDSGGQGVAVGSHKSDRRLTAYQRGKERPAMEVQLRKRAVEAAWDRFLRAPRGDMYAPNRREREVAALNALWADIVGEADKYCAKVTGSSLETFALGENVLSAEQVQRTVASLLEAAQRLPKEAQQELAQHITMQQQLMDM